MPQQPQTAGDPIPPGCEVIEVHGAELKQLFNAIDPSPFREKDLDANSEEFIVGWAREAPRDARLALLVYLDRSAGLADEPAVLRDAMREFFSHRSEVSRQRLRQLFRVGRTSLLIGLAFLAGSLLLGDFIGKALRDGIGDLLREGLLIGGWVAMWRPLEIFLYDWWPIRAETRLFDRLSAMPVRIAYPQDASSEAWRWDWPAVRAKATRPANVAAPRESASVPGSIGPQSRKSESDGGTHGGGRAPVAIVVIVRAEETCWFSSKALACTPQLQRWSRRGLRALCAATTRGGTSGQRTPRCTVTVRARCLPAKE